MDKLGPTTVDLQWPSSSSKGIPSGAKGPIKVGLGSLIFAAGSEVEAIGGEADRTRDISRAAIRQGDGGDGVVNDNNAASTTSSLAMDTCLDCGTMITSDLDSKTCTNSMSSHKISLPCHSLIFLWPPSFD